MVMVIKVGINGFGRVGRVVFRTCLQTSDIEITAINDPAIEVDYISYLIKYDSTHGRIHGNVSYTNDEIQIDGQIIKVFRQKYPVTIPWSQAGVQYVIEASGMFTNMEKALGHLASDTVKRVIVTAPSVDVPMVIVGVNDNIEIEQRVISCGSSTLYCLAPIIKVLEEHYGVEAGFITSIHAMTPSLKPLDGLCLRGKHWRDHRSILQNIIPATTGACKALGKIIPRVRDKLSGLAFRVPIVNVSVLDLSIRLLKPTSIEGILRNVEVVSKTTMKNIITVSKDETVSSDFMNETHSCVFDAESSLQLAPNFFKIICWYENEYSYACRVIDLLHLSEKQFEKAEANRMALLKTKFSKGQDVILQTEDNTKNPLSNPNASSTEKKNTKYLTRPVLLKKPLILHHNSLSPTATAIEPNKNKVELFKVWNDENMVNSNNVRHNRASFFQACNKPHTQDRLEKVKEEFSKMVSITELLLKKSYSNKLPFKFEPPKEHLDVVKLNTNTSDIRQIKNNRQFIKLDMSGDGGMSDCTVHFNRSEETVQPVHDSKMSDLSMVETIHSTQSKYKNSPIPEKVSSIYEDTIASQGDANDATINKSIQISSSKLLDQDLTMTTFKRQMSKTFCNIIKNFQFQIPETSTVKTNQNNINEGIRNENNDDKMKKFDVKMLPQVLSTTSEFSMNTENNNVVCKHTISADHQITNGQTDTVETQQLESVPINKDLKSFMDNMTKLTSIDRLDVELKKRNIVIVDEENNVTDVEQDNMQLDKALLEEVEAKETEGNLHVSISMPSSSFAPLHTYKRVNMEKNQDIYDKLDSPIIGTDSENSLNANKSQVIHISDLTNSLDDLERLDKICRIIELSDELSDKLFSPLDNYKDDGEHTKRWSFKDLCDKICLDEFCNQVFGK